MNNTIIDKLIFGFIGIIVMAIAVTMILKSLNLGTLISTLLIVCVIGAILYGLIKIGIIKGEK